MLKPPFSAGENPNFLVLWVSQLLADLNDGGRLLSNDLRQTAVHVYCTFVDAYNT